MKVSRLIFEGSDDKHVVMNLLFNYEHEGERLDERFNEKIKDGIDHLIGTLKEELGATDYDRLGVILDAEMNIDRQWARITQILDDFGCLDVPPRPNAKGTIVKTPDGKKIGIWVMPDNQNNGMLEDFIAGLIAGEDDLWPKAGKDVDDIPVERRRFRESYLSKAKVHTWLAWQEEPGTRLGQTFKKKYLDPNHPMAVAFVAWIKRLLSHS